MVFKRLDQEGKITIQARVLAVQARRIGPSYVEIPSAIRAAGISREQLDKIFRPFYTTKRGGTGLGLSLCRRIISQHGGTLTAESEIKKGSRFIIRLPMREAVEEAQVRWEPGVRC